MSVSDEEYTRWLRSDSARRRVLLEIDTDPPRRLAVVGYTTLPTDPVPNTRYDALVRGGVSFNESLSLQDGTSRASYANIDLHNEDGALDGWLDAVWHNRSVRIFYGDAAWSRADYRHVASGVIDQVEQTSSGMSIVLVDAAARLDEAVTDEKIGGGPDAERLMPLAFGECHNITPALFAAAQHEYRFHGAATERVIEVRDLAVPVSVTSVPGGFRLIATPKGEITASVQGDVRGGVYRNRVAQLVELLATQYGPASTRFSAADLDAVNLAAFDAAHPQPVGLYLTDRSTVLSCIVELAGAVGAQPVMSRQGRLRLLKVELPAVGGPRAIRPDSYEQGSMQVAGQIPPVAGVRLGYCRNWTPGQGLTQGLPPDHVSLYGQEWLTVSRTAPAVAASQRIETEVEPVNVLLLRTADAEAEAARRLALWQTPRRVFRLRGFAELLDLELGQAVTLYGRRFGLQAGRTGQVVGLVPDWTEGRIDVEVLV